jgi:cellulose synthase/poly-beta-1,6-N-acetylglucosamine synthase-like glycosyltransferase
VLSAEGLLWASGLLVLYSYVGYPVLIALLARLRPAPPVARAPIEPKVTLLIVAHNEEERIGAKLRNSLAIDYPRDRLDILVASDGSWDGTDEVVSSFSRDGVRLLRLPGPKGKPSALNEAVPLAEGEILVLCDARQRLDKAAVRELVSHFADPTVGAVSGELHIDAENGSASGEGVGLYWRYEKAIRRAESVCGSTVGATGALYAFRKALFRPLDPGTILDDVAVPMRVAEAGYRVTFEPAAAAFDEACKDAACEYRRKVRTLAGNYQLVALYPSFLDPRRNRLTWHFVSHKLSRLVVPWCLAVCLLSSGWLWAVRGSAPHGAVFAAQVLFYALAGAGFALERLGRRPRLLSVPCAVTLLNVAAAAALPGFLRGTQKAAWKAVGSVAGMAPREEAR